MTNSNNTDSRARSNAKIPKVLYDLATLGDGTVIIKEVVVPREDVIVIEKAKDAASKPA